MRRTTCRRNGARVGEANLRKAGMCRAAIPDWQTLSEEENTLFARQAEVFAGYIDMTDHEIGRIVEAIDMTGEFGNTLILLAYGDNGTSSEGDRNGMFSEMAYFNGVRNRSPAYFPR